MQDGITLYMTYALPCVTRGVSSLNEHYTGLAILARLSLAEPGTITATK